MEALKTVHMTEADKKWVDPHHSPVMFEVWHMVYLYFNAINGHVGPMIEFIVNGRYDRTFVDHVKPDFGRPDEDLFLF